MLNQTILAGRLTDSPEIVEDENNNKRTYITIAVPRSYKNVDGTYDTDFIRCTLYNGIAETTCEYCKKNDVLGIKGHIQTIVSEEGKYTIEVIAEKVSFLSSRKVEE